MKRFSSTILPLFAERLFLPLLPIVLWCGMSMADTSTIGILPDHGAVLPSTCIVGQLYFLTTGSVGLYSCNTANTWTQLNTGTGTIGSSTQYANAYYSGATAIAGAAAPALSGDYAVTYHETSDAAVAPSAVQVGMSGRSISGATTQSTIAYSDNATTVTHDVAGSAAVAVTLPVPTTSVAGGGLGNASFVFRYCNHSTQNDTITPTTWTIQQGGTAAATQTTVYPGQCQVIKIDPNSATDWLADGYNDTASTFRASNNTFIVNTSGLPTSVGNVGTAGMGVATVRAMIQSANNSADITNQTAYAIPNNNSGKGIYLVQMYTIVQTVATTSSTLPTGCIKWTDRDTANATLQTNVSASSTGNTTATFGQGVITINAASNSNIQYASGANCTSGTTYASSAAAQMKYAVRIAVTQISTNN